MSKNNNTNTDSAGKFSGRPGPGGRGHMSGLLEEKQKARNTKKTLLRLWSYLGEQRGLFILVFIMSFLGSIPSLAGPYYIGLAIDAMTGGLGKVDFSRLETIVFWMLGMYICGTFAMWLQVYLIAGVSQNVVRRIRKDLFAHLQLLPLRFFDTRTHGELMSRLTNDVENINNTLSQSVTQVFSSMIMLPGSIIMMFWLDVKLAVLALVSVPLGILLTRQIAGVTRKQYSQQQEVLGKLNGMIEETISGQKVVKSFVREAREIERFSEVNNDLRKKAVRAQIYTGLIPPLMNAVNNLGFAIVACSGGWMAIEGMLTVGVVASFLNYSRQFARPINELANQFNLIQSALAGAERVFEVMEEQVETGINDHEGDKPEIKGEVVFQKVNFGYDPDVPILKEVELSTWPGKTIALVGPTGAGKTTIINLLTRFYEVDAGRIIIDGNDIRDMNKRYLRSSLGIVLQDTYLFSESVRENIRFGRLDATDAEVEAAARTAYADHFIRALPDGYETILTEDGGNLSQGQRQLLAISRVILADPAILVLDEATSSVDTRTEMHIQKAMLALMHGRTSFVIAHRLSTIRDADEILFVRDGRIAERGHHHQLLEAKGYYYDLYESQFRCEESYEAC